MRVLNSLSDLNISRILRLIWQEKKISRIDISTRLQMNKSTVTRITSELTDLGLIREADSGVSGPMGGRKPVFLEVVGTYATVGGVEINPESVSCSLINLTGEVLFENRKEIDVEEYAEIGCLGLFKQAYELLQKEAKKKKIPFVGVGLGISGIVNSDKGLIVQSIPLLIKEPLDFEKECQKFAKVPVFVENDARCCCYTERMIAEDYKVEKNTMYVMVEHRRILPKKDAVKTIAVGFGIVFNGKIYHGSDATAGEFRSLLWKSGGMTQFASCRTNLDSLEDSKTVKPLFKELAQNIALLVNTFNFDIVYVGGLDKEYIDQIIKYIREEIIYLWPYEWTKTTMVTPGVLSKYAVSYGVASMVLDKLISLPEVGTEYDKETHRKSLLDPELFKKA
jgi:predicted NBD/HSP70 family sugar kinase